MNFSFHRIEYFFLATNINGQIIQCGEMAEDGTSHTKMAVTTINAEQNKVLAKGYLFDENEVDPDVVISMPANRLQPLKEKVNRKDCRMLKVLRRSSYSEVIKLLRKNHEVRVLLRKQQICSLLREEVSAALRSMSYRRLFTLGFFAIGIDEGLLGLDLCDHRKIHFRLLDGTLSKLDDLLGVKWDVMQRDGHVLFTVELTLSLNHVTHN